MSPIERAARALFIHEPGPYGDCVEWAIEQPFGWRDNVDQVRLVLEAFREPSDAMSESAFRNGACGGHVDCWQAMIDAALEEITPKPA